MAAPRTALEGIRVLDLGNIVHVIKCLFKDRKCSIEFFTFLFGNFFS